MKTIGFRIFGERLLMQSDVLVDPLNEIVAEIKEFTSKRKKTDADQKTIGELEFLGALYFDEELGPVIPCRNIERMLRDAGAMQKLGKAVQRGIFVGPDYIPLLYDGPRDLNTLRADRRFHDRRSVVVSQGKRVIRERPIFRNWALQFEITFDPSILKEGQTLSLLENAGRYVGLGTFRPKFGRFEVERAK